MITVIANILETSKGVMIEIDSLCSLHPATSSESLICALDEAGFLQRISLFDYALNENGVKALEKAVTDSGQSLASGFYCGNPQQEFFSNSAIKNHE